MDLGLDGKVAMVAASTDGLGFATARALVREGCSVAICGRDNDRLHRAEACLRDEGGTVHAHIVDVTSNRAISQWVDLVTDHFGGLDVLVTNCGGVPTGAASSQSGEDFCTAFRSVFLPAVHLVNAALPHIKRSSAGRILMTASEAIIRTPSHFALSGSARAGLVPYCHALVQELAGLSITVNVIAPGAHKTRIHEANRTGANAEAIRALEARTPAGRLGMPDEFGALAAFLASSQAGFITGTLQIADGGLNATA